MPRTDVYLEAALSAALALAVAERRDDARSKASFKEIDDAFRAIAELAASFSAKSPRSGST